MLEKNTNVVWHEQSINKERLVENKMVTTALSFGLLAYPDQENQHLQMQLQHVYLMMKYEIMY